MDVLSILGAIGVIIVTVILLYVVSMSKDFRIFKEMGIPALSPLPGLGNLVDMSKSGLFEFHKVNYNKFDDEKVYGYFEPGSAMLVIRDLDMIQNIMVKNFNNFVNRRILTTQKPFHTMLPALKDDHWHQVRSIVHPTFSTEKLKQMCLNVERCAKNLVCNLREMCKNDEDIELKTVISCYTMDTVASTVFGVSIDSLKNGSGEFTEQARLLMKSNKRAMIIRLLLPFLMTTLNKFGIGLFPQKPLDYFCSFANAAVDNRKNNDSDESKGNDFVQLLTANEETKEKSLNENKTSTQHKSLTTEEVQGQAVIFLLAGYDAVSSVLSFALFSLANHPEMCSRLQEELDTVLSGESPTYDTTQALPYLDMCLNETLRMYPPGLSIDRVCSNDCVVDGVKIPKGMKVVIPVVAIHHDPQHYPDPEKFDPERFSEENKEKRHPFAHLPFGQGPRNCIGWRLGFMELKLALAAILQEMTPVPCDQTVYPPTMCKFQLKAEKDLWVRMVSRKRD